MKHVYEVLLDQIERETGASSQVALSCQLSLIQRNRRDMTGDVYSLLFDQAQKAEILRTLDENERRILAIDPSLRTPQS